MSAFIKIGDATYPGFTRLPPYVGWWCVGIFRDRFGNVAGTLWRWWDGSRWSVAVQSTDCERTVMKAAKLPSHAPHVFWCHHWPKNARVERQS